MTNDQGTRHTHTAVTMTNRHTHSSDNDKQIHTHSSDNDSDEQTHAHSSDNNKQTHAHDRNSDDMMTQHDHMRKADTDRNDGDDEYSITLCLSFPPSLVWSFFIGVVIIIVYRFNYFVQFHTPSLPIVGWHGNGVDTVMRRYTSRL